jgi:hypothetical protein
VNPLDLSLPSQRISETVEAVTDDAINPFHTGQGEGLGKLIGNGSGHVGLVGVPRTALGPTANATSAGPQSTVDTIV